MEQAVQQHTTVNPVKQDKSTFFGKKTEPPFFTPLFIQPKLSIGPVDDRYEREADAIADKVMRMSDTETLQAKPSPVNIQRKCAACDEEEKLQRKCHYCEEEEKLQMKGESGAVGGMTVPSTVHKVINSGGQRLDDGTRRFMESRFGYDFGNVQIHNDSLAHRSSADINALAYTHGNHVVFGAGQYKPHSDSGKQLMAHELVHIIQQKSLANSCLQRLTVAKSWAGEFTADNYSAFYANGDKEGMEYGAIMEMFFWPNEFVDAEKIAFIQTAQSMVDGIPIDKYTDDGADNAKVSASRRIPFEATAGPGTHIDQLPAEITPIYGAYSTASDITKVKSDKASIMLGDKDTTEKLMEMGWRYVNLDGEVINRAPKLVDQPDLVDPDPNNPVSLEQNFESAVVALAGNQKGAYYGSVEWGWKKGASDINPQLKTFKIKSNDIPSSTFGDAVTLWNRSGNTAGEQSILVPVIEAMPEMFTRSTELRADDHTIIGKLRLNTRVKRISARNQMGTDLWSKVVVLDGRLMHKTGYANEEDLFYDKVKTK